MNPYDYAMQMEKDGESYYRDAAARTISKGLRNILTMLADEEVKHYSIFKQMKEQTPVTVKDTTILGDVKNIFVAMRETGDVEEITVSQIELYKQAQEIEKKTKDFYLERVGKAGDAREEDIFLRIAKEEDRHYFILEQIIEFVSRPNQWLENAEWYHLEEY
jgi:rubrerythrin